MDTLGKATESRIITGKADRDLDRRPEVANELGHQSMAYTSLTLFLLGAPGTILLNTCQIHQNSMILPKKMLENELELLVEKNKQLLSRLGVKWVKSPACDKLHASS